MDDFVRNGAKVTDKCYESILNPEEYLNADMLMSLLQSGYLPATLHGQKPLDYIASKMEEDEDFKEQMVESHMDEILSLRQNDGSRVVQLGVTYKVGGVFEGCLPEDYAEVEDNEEKTVSPRSEDLQEKRSLKETGAKSEAEPQAKQARTS